MNCTEPTFESPKTSIFRPQKNQHDIKFIYVKQKELVNDEEFEPLNEVVEFKELKQIQCPSETDLSFEDSEEITAETERVCFNCGTSENNLKMACVHHCCASCIVNLLEISCEGIKIEPLRCICKKVIPIKIIETIVSAETVLDYLERLSKLNLSIFPDFQPSKSPKSIPECFICGYMHEGLTCIANYTLQTQKNNPKEKCIICASDSDFQLSCSHQFCKLCLKSQLKKALDDQPLKAIECSACVSQKTIIPVHVIYEAFGSKDAYINYQQMCIENTYLAPSFQCKICLSAYQAYQLISLDCDHRFCYPCIRQYILQNISDNKVTENELTCPSCSTAIDANIIKAQVTEKTFNRYLELCLMKFQPKIEEKMVMKWCFKCDFGMMIDVNQRVFECPNCQKCFCPRCNNYHSDSWNCAKVTLMDKNELAKAAKDQKYVDELLKDSLICPQCGQAVSKDGGCSFMVCPWAKCGIYFCGICKKKLSVRFM
jgi:hypothetical protein